MRPSLSIFVMHSFLFEQLVFNAKNYLGTLKENSMNDSDEVQLNLFGSPAPEENQQHPPRRVGPPPPYLPANTEPDFDPDTGEMFY